MATALPTQIASVLSPNQITLLRFADDFGRRLSKGELRDLVSVGLAQRTTDSWSTCTVLTDAGRAILLSARLAVRGVAR